MRIGYRSKLFEGCEDLFSRRVHRSNNEVLSFRKMINLSLCAQGKGEIAKGNGKRSISKGNGAGRKEVKRRV